MRQLLRFSILFMGSILLAACQATSRVEPSAQASTLVGQVIAAHGGMERWRQLQNITMGREHQYEGTAGFSFHIFGEYPTGRIYQTWEPTGEVVWDGERAWSVDWSRASRLSPRFVMSIGFYLVNMPWLLDSPEVEILSTSTGELPSRPGKVYDKLLILLEAPTVRKPSGLELTRDHFDLFIDPDTHRIAAVMQYRTHAGQLDNFSAPSTEDAFVELFVPDDYVEVNGLVLPGRYTILTPEGELSARGRFFDYVVNVPVDAGWFVPPPDAVFDNSSSYQRMLE